jgi:anti-anti-sigma factor
MNDPVQLATSVSTERIGAIAIVHLFGELDLATVDQVEREITAAADGVTGLIVDLDGLGFLGSSGLALLVRWAHRTAGDDIGLRIVAQRREVLRPIHLTELHTLLNVDSTVDEALAAVRRQPIR